MSQCTCGHMRGDHQSSGARGLATRRYGVCVVSGCDCREYAEAEAMGTPESAS